MKKSLLFPDPKRTIARIQFSLRSLDKESYQDVQALQQEFLAKLSQHGLETYEAGIPLDSKFLPEIVDQFLIWKKSPNFKGKLKLNFMLDRDVSREWDWFEIHCIKEVDIDLWKWECPADRMPARIDWAHYNFVSERCKSAIEREGLTGLEFVWVCDKGQYRAPQWFYAMPTHPLGRGLDHPFFDPAKGADLWHAGKFLLPEHRNGIVNYYNSHFRENVSFGDATADMLLGIFGKKDIWVRAFRQFLRRFIPQSDFAYTWGATTTPILCCNARARAFLLNNGFLSIENFRPVWIWDKDPEGAVVLDNPELPCRTAAPLPEADWHRALARAAASKLHDTKKPLPVVSQESILNRLASRRNHFRLKADPSAAELERIAKNFPKFPGLWLEVLKLANGIMFRTGGGPGRGCDSYEAAPISHLPEFHAEYQTITTARIPSAPPHLIHFASEGSDDWLAFDLDTLTETSDCRVLKFDHETLSIVREWPSILLLLEEALRMEEEDNRE